MYFGVGMDKVFIVKVPIGNAGVYVVFVVRLHVL